MNQTIFTYLNSFALQSELFDTGVIFIAIFLGGFLVAGLLWFIIREFLATPTEDVRLPLFKKWGIVIFGSAIAAWAISEIINRLFPVPRPLILLDDVTPLFFKGENDAFPSGHATFFSALATALYFYHRQLSILYFAGALAIGLSRIIAGIHWPTDILAGYVLGGVIAYVIYRFYRW